VVASAARRREPFSGVRPLDLIRDLRAVADLIAEAFRDDMDPAGERAVREMRLAGRWAFLFGWLDRLSPPGEGIAPGFVWIEDDRLVGNASVRRIGSLGRGWMIGNVAVKPEWRRRGIARSLMEAALNLARSQYGEWIALQVRSDSLAAKSLYESMGFQATGESVQYRRTRFIDVAPSELPAEGQLRRGTAFDMQSIFSVAQAALPQGLRWAEPLRRDDFWLGLDRRLSNWLTGRREAWWVVESSFGLVSAVHLEVPRPPDDGRLRMWVAPPQQGRCEDRLLRAALASVGDAARRPIGAMVPAGQSAARAALEAAGFEVRRTLTHMRLDLR